MVEDEAHTPPLSRRGPAEGEPTTIVAIEYAEHRNMFFKSNMIKMSKIIYHRSAGKGTTPNAS